jgi:hypothetical protein
MFIINYLSAFMKLKIKLYLRVLAQHGIKKAVLICFLLCFNND